MYYSAEQKDKMEAENQSMVLNFGSQLDQGLKDLHRTILGSVSQQQRHLRCMEEHVRSYLASKCDVRKDCSHLIFFLYGLYQLSNSLFYYYCQVTQELELRVKKMTETYTSGAATLKELANTLQRKAASDMEQINSTISKQAMAVENVRSKEDCLFPPFFLFFALL